MAITRDSLFVGFPELEHELVVWEAITRGYGIERWHSPDMYTYKYGLWRVVGPNQGKVPVGVFDTPEEVVAILKLLFASTEEER